MKNVTINTAVNTLFGMTIKESTSIRRAEKKAERENAPVTLLWDGKWDELGNKWGAKVSKGTK